MLDLPGIGELCNVCIGGLTMYDSHEEVRAFIERQRVVAEQRARISAVPVKANQPVYYPIRDEDAWF
ncbi:hypothetical protein [Nocardia tengchongensis]|uniref:hypothetical protein n=1 Tax=Nocardia tengchongensis TaxID=2055889 RepID=UPI003660B959